MKKLTLRSLTITTLLLISSCSSLISKDDCKKDMLAFGLDHGKHALSNLSEDVRRVCVTSDETVDLEAYQKGFNIGWTTFCTPFHGFEMGSKGDIYKSFCPVEKEELFHEKFLIGKKVYEKKDQVIELEEKIKEITPNTEKDLSAREELLKIQDYLRGLKREIQSLEQQGMSLVHTN